MGFTDVYAEVYETDDGLLTIYAYRGDALIWQSRHKGDEGAYEAACDFMSIFNGVDPVAAEWESDGLFIDDETGQLIASTAWYRGDDNDMFARWRMGSAGFQFLADATNVSRNWR